MYAFCWLADCLLPCNNFKKYSTAISKLAK